VEHDDATDSRATPPVSGSTTGSVEDLSDVWLWQAVTELVQSFGGGAERSLRAVAEGRYDDRPGIGYFNARLTGARLSMMFSAFAAEAYINRFLHNRLSGRDLKTALRIRPPAEKFAVGTRLALGQTLFPRGEDIYERLQSLFRLRNRLVHSEPRPIEPEEVLGESAYEEFNPLAAYNYVEIVARAAKRLLQAHDPPASTQAADQLLDSLSMLRPIAEEITAAPIPTREQMLAELAEAQAAHPQFFLRPEPPRDG
jgi:hypothetical protein